ncbi:MAG TPA: Nramp family divalent metal transporter, partial [Pirellulaceae bacterium]|nr:Nramp family divalent metal transporter [Pirellulaceae bacterium]
MSVNESHRFVDESAARAARYLPPWTHGQLPEPPAAGWRLWIGLIGPGIVLAGTSIGSGEWLFGPAVSAQYGATLLWLALISIVLQVFTNLMMMRYAVYCGEPIVVGGLRTWPGPSWWITMYAILDFAAIWPYNASNAAVPLAAALLGHLPGAEDQAFVKGIGFAIFLLSFVPLIFGGTVYRMLEKVMTFKLVVVLGYLSFVAIFMVSTAIIIEVFCGFFLFGTVPLRADTVIAGKHFTVAESLEGGGRTLVKGTFERGQATIAEVRLEQGGKTQSFKLGSNLPLEIVAVRDDAIAKAKPFSESGDFFVSVAEGLNLISAEGEIEPDGVWTFRSAVVKNGSETWEYATLDDIPAPNGARLRELVAQRGLERVNLLGYLGTHGRLPPLDWAMLASFCAIAGAGGLSNTLFSNYARDKGWGMGKHVGAIPSAVGGMTISLSHVGQTFDADPIQTSRWRGWMRHIFRDQVAVWLVCSVLGMALPCMLSLQFIRNATVAEHRVAAMVAEGMADKYPAYGGLFWVLTLLCGFLILAPGQVSVGDQIARRWTDIIWSTSAWARRQKETAVGRVYYSILAGYAIWGVIALALFPPLLIAKIGAVLANVAL